MRNRLSGLLALLLASCGPGLRATRPAPVAARPRLVVQITIDQLRADLLTRYEGRYGADGFARFLRAGLLYTSAHYAHAATETAVGHTTLFTGALPRDHGIVGNEWYDQAQRRPRLAVEDAAQHLLGEPARAEPGASPRALRATTLGDELRAATGGAGLVFSVSIKDRSAIFSGGHAGKAFWLDDARCEFATSDYYYPQVPAWLAQFNRARPARAYGGQAWQLVQPAASYASADDRPHERSHKQLGRLFPHPLPAGDSADYCRALRRTPFADELTLDVVEALLAAQPLGGDAIPDLLAISFSATDYIAHAFGPESREVEDDLLRLDRTLVRLFALLLRRVPERELLVVLSSDHGGPDSPDYLQSLGVPAGRHDVAGLLTRLRAGLAQRFGEGEFLLDFVNPALWLDEAAIARAGRGVEEVERALAELVLGEPGFALAVTRSDLARGSLPPGDALSRVQASFDRERSGHVYLVPQPGWLLAGDAAGLSSMHGTPHAYDTHVPIAFWGLGVAPARSARPVDPRDIAVTLAELLQVSPPSAASGRPLLEVLGH